ncbi:MAG: hypothetical protein EOP85_06760 [Verrucomicrobiaceae bacterium]|nr:MAG: hypothetical protein EOP85_06760 [Verrucomicrobiaceae bacterium]
MKNLVLTAFTLVASVQISCAGLIDDLVGKWKVNNTKPGYSITTVFKKVGAKGLKASSTIVIPGLANATGVTNYKANGTVNGTVKRDGVVQVRLSGTWRVSGNTLIEDVKLTSPALPAGGTQKTKVKLVNANKLSTVSTVNGSRTTGTLARVR